MDRYRNVCVWFMARNCRFPKVGTHGCQRGNHRLPLQGTPGSQRFFFWTAPIGFRLVTTLRGLPADQPGIKPPPVICPRRQERRPTNYSTGTPPRFPEVGTHGSQPGNQRSPLQATAGSHLNFQFLKVGTDGSQRGNQRLPWQGTAGSQTLKLTVNLGTRGYHCKELPVPRS